VRRRTLGILADNERNVQAVRTRRERGLLVKVERSFAGEKAPYLVAMPVEPQRSDPSRHEIRECQD